MSDEKSTAIKVAMIGFVGVIIAALITIYPQIRSQNGNMSQREDPKIEIPKQIKTDSAVNTVQLDRAEKPKNILVKVPSEDIAMYDLDKDFCGTLFSIISDARYGFHNLKTHLDTIKTKPWIETRLRTKIKSLVFETCITKSTMGNKLWLSYHKINQSQAIALMYNQYLDKIKNCLKSEGRLTINKYGNKFYDYTLNDYCEVRLSFINDPSAECSIQVKSLVVGDKD